MARRKSSSASPALTPRTPAVGLARGRAGVKRHAPPRLAAGVGTPSLRRLARRAGVKRIALPTYQSVREALNAFLRKIVADTACLVENRRRFTVTLPDVLYALKRNGRTLYGWSGEGGARAVLGAHAVHAPSVRADATPRRCARAQAAATARVRSGWRSRCVLSALRVRSRPVRALTPPHAASRDRRRRPRPRPSRAEEPALTQTSAWCRRAPPARLLPCLIPPRALAPDNVSRALAAVPNPRARALKPDNASLAPLRSAR